MELKPPHSHNKYLLRSPVLHHVPLLSCLAPAELHVFLKVIPSTAVAICEQEAFQLQTRLITQVSAALLSP